MVISAAAALIYVKVKDIAAYAQKVIGHNVVDLSAYNCPSFPMLGGKFKNVFVCNQHERRKTFFHFSDRCALYRALLLKEWFWSLVPEDWLQKPVIGSELFNSLLHTKTRRDVRFDGYDVPDVLSSSAPSSHSTVRAVASSSSSSGHLSEEDE